VLLLPLLPPNKQSHFPNMAAWPAAAASLLVAVLSCCTAARAIKTHGGGGGGYVSAVGDPGMRRDGLRVAWEAWNFCNEVGQEAPGMGSPRGADCFDLGRSIHFFSHLFLLPRHSSSVLTCE